jgi:dihydroorotate dehydrogenase
LARTGRRETYRSRQQLASRLASLGTAFLRWFPAETAHEIGMTMLERGVLDWLPAPAVTPLSTGMGVVVPGIGSLPHPFGLAAGFDKHARAPKAFARLGFSFLEVGTVTPQPQPGNPKPRVFRYPEQRALINRMGFNSDGAATVSERLKAAAWDHERVPLGVNCGKNKDTPLDRAIFDYLTVMESMGDAARYFVVNISSPNTPGLRELASPQFLNGLADELGARLLPRTWVKLDPDLGRKDFQALIAVLAERGYQGVIISNTHRVAWPEPGGQSGHPLTALSNTRLEWAHEVSGGRLPMIASGGVLAGIDAFEKLARGAIAVQLYTALVYRGPWAVAQMLVELAAELALRGFAHVEDAIGSHYRD